MVFTSIVFLLIFLPTTLATYHIVPSRAKNLVLLLASIFFYCWGAEELVILLFISILIDYVCGWIQIKCISQTTKKRCLQCSLVVNLGLLLYFKYANFFIDNVNLCLEQIGISQSPSLDIALPIGISFYTFQTLSYQIDLYYGRVKHQRSLLDFSLFVALFPQLVAGPIVRYRDIEHELKRRTIKLNDFSYGIYRMIVGFSKKVLLADPLGGFSDYIFSRPLDHLPIELAWLGALVFSLQIYLDFSAYSDIAIGLGRMFGFHFPENFRYPFTARTVHEFWQRWHITLTKWFRDYVYGWLKGVLPGGRTMKSINTLIVFVLVGFWHGANWTFIFWGFYFGLFLVLERNGVMKIVSQLPTSLQHLYLLVVVAISAVLFRSTDLFQVFDFIVSMFGGNDTAKLDAIFYIRFDHEMITRIGVAMLASTPVVPWLTAQHKKIVEIFPIRLGQGAYTCLVSVVTICSLFSLFGYSIATLVARSKNPFIYFQF